MSCKSAHATGAGPDWAPACRDVVGSSAGCASTLLAAPLADVKPLSALLSVVAEGGCSCRQCWLSVPSDCRNPADPDPSEDLTAYWQWFSFAGAGGPVEVGGGLKTDHWFYGLFQSAPDLIALLLPAAGAAGASAVPSLGPDSPGDASRRGCGGAAPASQLGTGQQLLAFLDGVIWLSLEEQPSLMGLGPLVCLGWMRSG